MKVELLVTLATFAVYMQFEQNQYKASWRVHLFAVSASIFVLKFVKDLDMRARLFIMSILAWHIIDVLNNAIGESKKNEELVHRYARTKDNSSGVDAGVGTVASEVPRECGETIQTESGLGTQDMG
jgi:hypothetical protein